MSSSGSASGQNSTSLGLSTQSIRARNDIAWGHVIEGLDQNGRKTLTCFHCGKVNRGGGIFRMKQHLAGTKGDVGACLKVPYDVKYMMQESLKAVGVKNKEKVDSHKYANPYGATEHGFEGDMLDKDCEQIRPSGIHINEGRGGGVERKNKSAVSDKSKRKQSIGVGEYFAPRTSPGSQPSIRHALVGKEATHRVDMAFARFFYDACIPINAINSIYLQPLVDGIASLGPGYKHPNYHSLRVNLLKNAKKEVQLLVDSYRKTWETVGCTLMADGWTDNSHRSLINFMVYCPKGVCFVKSVDASDVVKDAQTLCKLFEEVVLRVGPNSIMQFVSDNGANYKAAGRMLSDKFPSISWSPCAAHCINLVLKDIGEMDHIVSLTRRASEVTRFLYNHTFLLAWLRKRQGWKEIVRPGATRFATTFIALRSLHEHKRDLQAMGTNTVFVDSRYAKNNKGKNVIGIILDNKFWDDMGKVCKVVNPLMHLLRIVDSDERPSIGYVYEGMYRARSGIKKLFKNKKNFYKPYTTIIKERWDRTLRRDIHVAAYYLNPAFQYDEASFINKPEVMSGFLDTIDKKARAFNLDKMKLMDESRIFRDKEDSFSRELAIQSSKTTRPDEWWRSFGYSAPNLQKFAIKILSQTSSSSGCERNWSVFERIHTKKRNRLEHHRLNDLVFVHYNLRLQNRRCYKKVNFDPIDYESIDRTESWIVHEEEEGGGELSYEELEQMVYADGEGSIPVGFGDQPSYYESNVLEDDDDDDDDESDADM